MDTWILFIVAGFYLVGDLTRRWISSNAIQALEPHHKAMLADLSKWSLWSGKKGFIVFVFIVIAAFTFPYVPYSFSFIYAFVVLANDWLTLRRLWSLEIPKTYKQKLLIGRVIYSVGLLLALMIVQEMILKNVFVPMKSLP